jgi:hypothetical protein
MDMKQKSLIWLFTALAAPALTLGCGDDARPPTDVGPGDGGDTSPPDTSLPDTGMRDTTVPSTDDGNDDFSEAVAITVGDGMGANEAIQTPADQDYFTFDLTAGDWAIIDIVANADDDPDMVDTVIQLFDSSMTMVAENDDGVPRTNTDSELIYHVPADGTYYVRVLEFSEWFMADPFEGDPTFTYTITVGVVDPMNAAVTTDREPGDDAASAQTLNTNMDFGIVLGTFDDESDIDVFSFSVTGLAAFEMMPAGATGYGSTAPVGNIWISDVAGTTIFGRLNNTMGAYDDLNPALAAGDYLLHVEHGGSTAGANDFFVLKAFLNGMENPPEAGEATNGVLTGAEALTQTTDMMTGVTAAFILAQLPDADVDYYSFDVAMDEVISVGCSAATSGGGVIGLTAEIRDASDTVVETDSETPPDGVFIDGDMAGVPSAGPGTYYLRLTKTGQDPEIPNTFVRCGVRTGVPMPMP